MDKLPLCPCGSGNLYEECCFKKKDSEGKPLFFKEAMFGDGNNWHPIPNSRIMVIVGGQSTDKYRDYAKTLIKESTLKEKNWDKFINLYGGFYSAYEQLLIALKKDHGGEGASFQTDSIESRKCWKDFLMNGRILIDFLGLHSRESLELWTDIGGLNKKSFQTLLNAVENKGLVNVSKRLNNLKEDIITFINIRDREKVSSDTILEFPAIDKEYGVIKDGKITNNGNYFDMLDFIEKSYKSINKLTIILIGSTD